MFRSRLLLIPVALSVFGYLGFSWLGGYLGFPLDDAWIHQTYARNLGTHFEFAFIPGQPSAGSTAPLWTGLLAVGYFLRLPYLLWTYLLGAALLGLNAGLVYGLLRQWAPQAPRAAGLAGLFTALEWHLVWSAVSGMETLLFSALVLAVFIIPPRRAGWLGFCAGLSLFVRPDGLTLLPCLLVRCWLSSSPRAKTLLQCLGVYLLVGLAYFLFLRQLTYPAPNLFPTTFYAKQAEYAAARALPLLTRLWTVGLQPLIGAQILLLPGLLAAWPWLRHKQWEPLLALAWVGGFIGLYALRLPVNYQHGRYVIPVLPLLLALGLHGALGYLRLNAAGRLAWQRVLSRAWVAALSLLVGVFWFFGASLYQRDVQIIESEMVATARWIQQNTPATVLVAAHDIGALGYFGQRRVLDMAGLISPEVIPFIRDETRLRAWLETSGADYLITPPGAPAAPWYSAALYPPGAQLVYTPTAPYAPAAGGTHMAIYALP